MFYKDDDNEIIGYKFLFIIFLFNINKNLFFNFAFLCAFLLLFFFFQGVKSEHQGEWYRRMFDSLHKVKDGKFYLVTYVRSIYNTFG